MLVLSRGILVCDNLLIFMLPTRDLLDVLGSFAQSVYDEILFALNKKLDTSPVANGNLQKLDI